MYCDKCGEVEGVFCINCKNADTIEVHGEVKIFGCNVIAKYVQENTPARHRHIPVRLNIWKANKKNNCKFYRPNFKESVRLWWKKFLGR